MDRSYDKPLDVPALARIALTSEAHFIRTFKQTFGETPHRYLQRRRLERAMALLRETERPVTEICLDVGFASLGSFSRTFTKVVGMSPTAYREAWRTGAGTAGYVPDVRGDVVDAAEEPAAGQQFRRSGSQRRSVAFAACSPPSLTPSSTSSTTTRPLDFYVGKLGLEVGTDADLGPFRWLSVHVPGRPESAIVLATPEMGHDEETAAAIRELVAKGGGNGVIFNVDDCRKTYDALVEKGVEFTQEPTEHFYGIDCGLRDPFGNSLRITQPAPGPIEIPSPEEFAANAD